MCLPQWLLGVLAILCCLILGVALGLWLFVRAGDHLVVVSRPLLVASYALGPLCAAIGALCVVTLALYGRHATPRAAATATAAATAPERMAVNPDDVTATP